MSTFADGSFDFGAPLSDDDRAQLQADRDVLAPYELDFRAFDACADVGDRMGELIRQTSNFTQLDDAERSLQDARARIELRLTEIAMRKVELSPPPPLIAAMEAAA